VSVRLRQSRRPLQSAVFALVLLACGALAHLEHHLVDPACDGDRPGATHPCACAASHAGAVAAPLVSAEPAPLPRYIERAPRALPAPDASVARVCAPRGPPLA
jgi:hypothetical protein